LQQCRVIEGVLQNFDALGRHAELLGGV